MSLARLELRRFDRFRKSGKLLVLAQEIMNRVTGALQQVKSTQFEPLPPPGPHDWLAVHPERGQTFEDFVKDRPNRPDSVRNRLYFQPLEEFTPTAPSLELLQQFATAFFAMPASMLPSRTGNRITSRKNPYSGHRQLLTTDILALLRKHLPADGFCILGITMQDLYPEESWNFVFGQASLRDRVGVYSFARYDPAFSGEHAAPANVMLRRSCKVLAHETSHMFGIEHCIFFRCLMNGSNHLAESDARPLHFCPVDLKKLHYSTGFDMAERYGALERFSRIAGFEDEADWLRRQLTPG